MAEQCLVAVERLNTYMEMEDEGSLETLESSDSLRSGWLADGSVRFENVVMRYREGTPLVLKGVLDCLGQLESRCYCYFLLRVQRGAFLCSNLLKNTAAVCSHYWFM